VFGHNDVVIKEVIDMIDQSPTYYSKLAISIFAVLIMLSGCGVIPSKDNQVPQQSLKKSVKPGYVDMGTRRGSARLHPLKIFGGGGSKSMSRPGSMIDDPDYAEYLEWKRWQEFKAYQRWKAENESQVGS
jgi:hypothetical protein